MDSAGTIGQLISIETTLEKEHEFNQPQAKGIVSVAAQIIDLADARAAKNLQDSQVQSEKLLKAILAGFDEKFNHAEKLAKERFDRIEKQFDRVDKRFDKVDERFDKVDERFDKVDERLNKVEGRLNIVEHKVQIRIWQYALTTLMLLGVVMTVFANWPGLIEMLQFIDAGQPVPTDVGLPGSIDIEPFVPLDVDPPAPPDSIQ